MSNGPFKSTGRDVHWKKYVGTESSNGSMLRPNFKYVQSHPTTSYVMRHETQDPRAKHPYVPDCL